jgi:3-(3-hydroxy-phenyl)propionate hydroxylase
LSMATVHDRSPLSTHDADPFAGSAQLGAPAPDAPVRSADGREGFLLEHLGSGFEVLHIRNGVRPQPPHGVKLIEIGEDLLDDTGLFRQRFDATPDATYVLRPDQHLAARFRTFDARAVGEAIERALAMA